MKKRSPVREKLTVGSVCGAMEKIAPIALAQDWDNVGLLAGDAEAGVQRVLLCIDLTESVFREAVTSRADMVLTYHPPIFKPIRALCVPGPRAEGTVFRCISRGIAVYSPHTALDAADGGTNDVLAHLCGIQVSAPLEYADRPGSARCKVVVFTPATHVDQVADAMFAAGAGDIGHYSCCSFRSGGRGTFLGGVETSPTVGRRGRKEYVDEIRLEVIARANDVPLIIHALRSVHPYEEPAFDIYPLRPEPVRGIGRVGMLPPKSTVASLVRKLKPACKAANMQTIGTKDQPVRRAVIVAGSAGELPFRIPLSFEDVIVTGEIRHHDALSIRRRGCSAIALGHWASERPVLSALAERLHALLPSLNILLSDADADPFVEQ